MTSSCGRLTRSRCLDARRFRRGWRLGTREFTVLRLSSVVFEVQTRLPISPQATKLRFPRRKTPPLDKPAGAICGYCESGPLRGLSLSSADHYGAVPSFPGLLTRFPFPGEDGCPSQPST